MIIQQFIQIRSHHRNQKWFKDKGCNVPKSYDFFTVKTCDLPKCCRLKIECQCDFCGETFFRPFCKISGDKQSCGKKKCKLELQKETMMEHFNVPFGVQCPEIRKKMEKTRIKKSTQLNVLKQNIVIIVLKHLKIKFIYISYWVAN